MTGFTARTTRRVGNLTTSEAEKAISNLTGWTPARVNNIVLRAAQSRGRYHLNQNIEVIADDVTQTYTLVITEETDYDS